MINAGGPTPLTPLNWDGGHEEADMHDLTTPSSDDLLAKYIPPAFQPRIFISHINKDEDWDKFSCHIKLEDGHWFAVIDDEIYCSLGKSYPHLPYRNMTKYLILQSPFSAICGAYASLFCVCAIRDSDPMSQIAENTTFVVSNSRSYQYDVHHKDINTRNDNDQYVARLYNHLR